LLVLFISLNGQKYSSAWFTTDDGLPQNSVKDMVKDRYGFLWISTEQGIIRYDGNTFTAFDHIGLNNLHFMTFSGDKEKDSMMIWTDEGLDAVRIRQRKPEKISNIPLRKGEHLLGRFYTYYSKRNLTEPTPLYAYMICLRTSKYLFSKNKIILIRKKKKPMVIRTPFDPGNMKNVFVIGETVFIRNPKLGNITMLANGNIRHMTNPLFSDPDAMIYWEQMNRQVFLIRKDRIYQIHHTGSGLTTKKILDYSGFRNHQFFSMYYDADYKILYLGSLTKGLQILKLMSFFPVKRADSAAVPMFQTFLPYTCSSVITPGGTVFDSSRLVKDLRYDKRSSLNSMLYDDQCNIVCFKKNVLNTYDRNSSCRLSSRVFPFDILNVFRSGGRYFLSSQQGDQFSLIEFKDAAYSQIRRRFPVSYKIECLQQYRHDSFLAGSANGLYVLDARYGTLKKIPNSPGIRKICRTADGNFWGMSFADGFFLFRDRKLIRMPIDHGNNLSTPHELLEDQKGFVWISTNNGLYKTHRKDLLEYAADPNKEVRYYRYSTKDGLNTNEFNGVGVPGAAILGNGQFVFPSMDGLVFFRPEAISSPLPRAGSIFAERVKTGDSIRYLHDTLFLKKNYHRAELYIDIPFYGHNENLVLETQVDSNFSKKWVTVGDNRIFVIESLPSGSHVLNIRTWIGGNRYAYKKINFYIQPYFYETKWFVILAGGVTMTTLVLLARRLYERFRTQKKIIRTVQDQLEQTEMMLESEASYQENLFQAITHDIATPIKHLSNLTQKMLDTENPALQRKYFDSVYKSTEELYNLTMSLREYREALNSSHIFTEESYYLKEAIGRKIKLFTDMAEYSGTRIINNVDSDILLSVKESIISIILQNLLDNAVKNTTNGSIIFNAYREGRNVIIMLSDTGKGMSNEKLDYYNKLYLSNDDEELVFRNLGLGLHLVIRLIKKINGHIEFKKQTQGTLVIIKIIDICSKEF